MKFAYNVKYNGIIYKAGEEVPMAVEKTAVEPKPVKATEEVEKASTEPKKAVKKATKKA